MASCGSYLESGPGFGLAPHLADIRDLDHARRYRLDLITRVRPRRNLHGMSERPNTQDTQVLTTCGLRSGPQGQETRPAEIPRNEGCTETAPGMSYRSVKSELAHGHDLGRTVRKLPIRSEHAEGDGEVIRRSDLRKIRRREIHDDAFGRELVPARCHGRSNPLLGLADGGIGKTDDDEDRLASTTDVGFDANGVRLDPDDGARCNRGVHSCTV